MTTETVSSETPATPLYVFSDGCEWVVAADEDDARAVWSEAFGGACDIQFQRLPDGETFGIWCNAAGEPDEMHAKGNAVIRRTAAEWAKLGRRYLCSTEW